MALPSSGQIHLGALADNNSSASRANISLQTYSGIFASGSVVDGNESQSIDRKNLDTAPYAISEFYDADFPNSQFDNPVAKFGTSTETAGFVEGETARIYADINQQINNTVRGGLKNNSDNSIAIVGNIGTNLSVADDTHYVNVTVPAGDSTEEKYYAFADIAASFKLAVNTDDLLDHYDAIGAVTITDPSDTTVAASSTEHEITHARSIGDESDITSYAWTFATTTGGDDGGNPDPTSATTSTPTVTYTGPGTYTANLTVNGDPSDARNSTAASAVTHIIEYTDSLTANDQSAGRNEGTGIAGVASHLGLAGGMKIGYVNVTDTGTFLTADTTDSTDTRFQAAAAISKTVTPAALTTTTISCKIRAEDKAASSTYDLSDNAFNLYPYVDGEFGADDIAISVDPVLVGSNTVLSIARNITDNIVGYRWSEDGAGSMTSDNLSGGNIGGASDDNTSIIN